MYLKVYWASSLILLFLSTALQIFFSPRTLGVQCLFGEHHTRIPFLSQLRRRQTSALLDVIFAENFRVSINLWCPRIWFNILDIWHVVRVPVSFGVPPPKMSMTMALLLHLPVRMLTPRHLLDPAHPKERETVSSTVAAHMLRCPRSLLIEDHIQTRSSLTASPRNSVHPAC